MAVRERLERDLLELQAEIVRRLSERVLNDILLFNNNILREEKAELKKILAKVDLD